MKKENYHFLFLLLLSDIAIKPVYKILIQIQNIFHKTFMIKVRCLFNIYGDFRGWKRFLVKSKKTVKKKASFVVMPIQIFLKLNNVFKTKLS